MTAAIVSLQDELAASLEQPAGHPGRLAAERAVEAAKALLRGQDELAQRIATLESFRNALRLLNRALSERAVERAMLQERQGADLIDSARQGKLELPDDEAVLHAERACAVVNRANDILVKTSIPRAEFDKRQTECGILLLEAKALGSHAAWRAANLAAKLGPAVEFDSTVQVAPGEQTRELTRLANERLQQHAAGMADLREMERKLYS